jgi:kynurenine formamidase
MTSSLMTRTAVLSFALLVAGIAAGVQRSVEPSAQRIVDLSHAFGPKTLYWPTSPSKFTLEKLASGPTPGGFFYAANSLCTPEHGGTHLDAPLHFSERGRATADIPLEQLVAPAVVIDITAQAAKNRDYTLSAQDVSAFEKQHGRIARGTIVLLKTGWSRRWPDAKSYLGDDTPGDASKLSFPSYGLDAAKQLIEARGAAALGIDTASIDYGKSTDFQVHRLAGANNVPGLENLTNLDQLPARGAMVVALPMKIEGGSGGPLRAIALVQR